MIDSTDQNLVNQCLEGDSGAFELIIDKYQKAIFNVAFRMCNNYEDARDITQTVFIKSFEKLVSFNPKYKFFSWIYRMAVNESLNFVNQKNRFEKLSEDHAIETGPDVAYEQMETIQYIENALLYLEPENRALIILKHFMDLSYQQIGYILDIPEKMVKSRLFTARQLLKNILLKLGFKAND
jgi:RNA polymerase sigma-70 factor (ECF subfamily)